MRKNYASAFSKRLGALFRPLRALVLWVARGNNAAANIISWVLPLISVGGIVALLNWLGTSVSIPLWAMFLLAILFVFMVICAAIAPLAWRDTQVPTLSLVGFDYDKDGDLAVVLKNGDRATHSIVKATVIDDKTGLLLTDKSYEGTWASREEKERLKLGPHETATVKLLATKRDVGTTYLYALSCEPLQIGCNVDVFLEIVVTYSGEQNHMNGEPIKKNFHLIRDQKSKGLYNINAN